MTDGRTDRRTPHEPILLDNGPSDMKISRDRAVLTIAD